MSVVQVTLFADPLADAEAVVLELCRVLLGDGGTDRGLMTKVACDRRHLPSCPHGEWISQTSPRPHGDPCSWRCVAANEALTAAERWLRANETARRPGGGVR